MNTLEDVLIVKVSNGTRVATDRKQLRSGDIIGVVAYPADDTASRGVVRARIQDSTGQDICALQNIKNYRSREAGYIQGCKPLSLKGGQAVTIEIIASEDFTSATSYDFIFIYAPEAKQACSM